MQKRCM